MSMKIINARNLQFTFNSSVTTSNNEFGHVNSVSCAEFDIQVDDEVKADIVGKEETITSPYKIASITQVSSHTYTCSTEALNKSYHYLLPTLGGTYNTFQCNDHLMNTYTINDKCPDLYKSDNNIYVRYRYHPSSDFAMFESSLCSHPCYRYTIEEGPFSTYAFKIPNEFTEDIKLFNLGKFSYLSKSLKNRIKYFYKLTPKSPIYGAIHRTKERREEIEHDLAVELSPDSELDSIPFNEQINIK